MNNEMSWRDQLPMVVAAGAIVATIGIGTCSTNGRFDDVNRRIDDVNGRINDLQTDIRELRSLVIEAIKVERPDNAAAATNGTAHPNEPDAPALAAR